MTRHGRALALMYPALGLAACAAPLTEMPPRSPPRQLPPVGDVRAYHEYMPAAITAPAVPEVVPLLRAFAEGASEGSLEHVAPDAAMHAIATAIAKDFARTRELMPPSVMQWLLWRHGVTAQYQRTAAHHATGSDAAVNLDAELAAAAPGITTLPGRVRLGVARVANPDGSLSQAIVAASDQVVLEALPKSVAPGARVTFAGRFAVHPIRDARFHLDMDGGNIFEAPLDVARNGAFRMEVSAPERPGRYFAQITSVFPLKTREDVYLWRSNLVWFPLFVGQAEDETPDAELLVVPNPAEAVDEHAWTDALLTAYNAARATKKLDPVRTDARLELLAKVRSRRLRAEARLGPDPRLLRRLAAEGILAREAHQSQGVIGSAGEAAWLHLHQPAHRAVILEPDTALAGFGAAPTADGQAVFVEYLVAPAPPLDAAAERARFFDEANRLREARGLKALARAPQIELLAERFAQSVCAGGLDPNDFEPLWQKVRDRKLGFAQMRGLYLLTTVAEPRDLERAGRALFEPGFTHMATAVCRGKFADPPLGTYVVFVLVAPENQAI